MGQCTKYIYMGWNYQDEKYALFVSLFVSFHGDLESKWAIRGLGGKFSVDKYTKDSNGMALFETWLVENIPRVIYFFSDLI